MGQTLFPLLQPPEDPPEPTPLTDQQILQALQQYEQGVHIIDIQLSLHLNKTDLFWIAKVTKNIVEFMDSSMRTLYANQPSQAQLLTAINGQDFGFSETVTQQVATYRRDHATTEEWRTAKGYANSWDGYRAVTRTD